MTPTGKMSLLPKQSSKCKPLEFLEDLPDRRHLHKKGNKMSYCHKSSVTFYNSDYSIIDFKNKTETKLKIDPKLKKKASIDIWKNEDCGSRLKIEK